MLRTIHKIVIICTLTFIILVTGARRTLALTVHFDGQGTFSTPSFTQGDLTVSSPDGDLYFSNGGGLGVNNSGLSQGETIVFDFAQLASDYRLFSPIPSLVTFELEAFDAHGMSLGLRQSQAFPLLLVDLLFDNQLISSFSITNIKDQYNNDPMIALIYYTPEPLPEPIPEPGTWMLLGFGLLGLPAFARRRWKTRK